MYDEQVSVWRIIEELLAHLVLHGTWPAGYFDTCRDIPRSTEYNFIFPFFHSQTTRYPIFSQSHFSCLLILLAIVYNMCYHKHVHGRWFHCFLHCPLSFCIEVRHVWQHSHLHIFIKHEQHFTTPTLYATEILGHAWSRRQKLEAYLYCSSYPPQ